MTTTQIVALVAVLAGVSCALAGVFLVLRRMAMMADAISHAILPGLVAGYWIAHGPSLLWGFLGAVAAGLATVLLVETLTKSRRVKEDSAIGLVFPIMFALGVFIVSKYFANVHIDADAVLYGEITLAPFDTLVIGGRDLGPQSLWVLGSLTIANALFIALLYKEMKLSTFDATLAASLGFVPIVLHYLLMAVVAVTTVGAFSAVGAILSVALIVVPPVTAGLLTRKLPTLIFLSAGIGAAAGLLGYWLSSIWDVSPSGMIATVLGLIFGAVLMFSPMQGLAAQILRLKRQRLQFATEMLVVHLSTHVGTPGQTEESSLLHIERELGWPTEKTARIADRAERSGLVHSKNGELNLTPEGSKLAAKVSER